jgi:hypothetical protein
MVVITPDMLEPAPMLFDSSQAIENLVEDGTGAD